MIHRKFGAQWTNGLGGDVTNVFVRKFKIAKKSCQMDLYGS